MEISDNDSAMSSDNEKDVNDMKNEGDKKESSVIASSKAKEKKIKEADEEKKPKKVHLRKDKGYGDHL